MESFTHFLKKYVKLHSKMVLLGFVHFVCKYKRDISGTTVYRKDKIYIARFQSTKENKRYKNVYIFK